MSRLSAVLDNFFDEQSQNRDSFTTDSLNTLSPGFISRGTISGAFDRDFYQITLSSGDYKVSMTSDASLYGWNTFRDSSFLEFDILDEDGNVLRSSSPTLLFDDEDTFFFPGFFGTFYVDVHTTGFSSADYALTITSEGSSVPVNRAPVAQNDTARATAGVATVINIGANDSDADGDRLTTTGITGFF